MLPIQKLLQSLRIAVLFGVVLAGTAGLFSTQLVAQNATDLTMLSDEKISAYRWKAMAKFYTAQPAVVDLTTLDDSEILTYRWTAMANYYAVRPALGDSTELSEISPLGSWSVVGQYRCPQRPL